MNVAKKFIGVIAIMAFIAFAVAPLSEWVNRISFLAAFLNVLLGEMILIALVGSLVFICLWAFK